MLVGFARAQFWYLGPWVLSRSWDEYGGMSYCANPGASAMPLNTENSEIHSLIDIMQESSLSRVSLAT